MMDELSRWQDLVSEMHAAVWEEAPLHELTLGAIDHLGGGRTVAHGPWSARECQSVLSPWCEAGWIEVIADAEPPWSLASAEWRPRATRQGEFLTLSTEDATALLKNAARWLLGTADGHAMLSRTQEGQAHEYPEWLELAAKAKDGA